jgi:hypothetical protein
MSRRLSIVTMVAIFAFISIASGCSSTANPSITVHDRTAGIRSTPQRIPVAVSPIVLLRVNTHTGYGIRSHYLCPAKGYIKYMSDYNNNVINVYTGKFAGQTPCGQITSGVLGPQGMYVKTATHDLYVANTDANNILVFHRGQTTAYNTYADPTIQYPVDVSMAKDGTVIASNIYQPSGGENGSLSTWIGGPNGGTFVGNFPMTNDIEGLFITVQKDGIVYYNDLDVDTTQGVLWSLKCPAGACGVQTQVSGVRFLFPGGMGSDATDDLLANDQSIVTADTFELPNWTPATFPLTGDPAGMAVNHLDHHWFIADAINNDAGEYAYPSGQLIGTVPGNPSGLPIGIAVDPGHTLK